MNDEFVCTGKVGRDLTLRDGYAAARIAGLNCLASLKAAVGDLDRVERIVKVVRHVNSVPEFTEHPQVTNSTFELFVHVFLARGQHARVARGFRGGSVPHRETERVSPITVRTREGLNSDVELILSKRS